MPGDPVIEITRDKQGELRLLPTDVLLWGGDFLYFTDSPELRKAIPTRIRVRTGPEVVETLRVLVVTDDDGDTYYYLPYSEVNR